MMKKPVLAIAVISALVFSFSASAAKKPKKTKEIPVVIEAESADDGNDAVYVEKKEAKPLDPNATRFIAHLGFDYGGDSAFTVVYPSGDTRSVKFGDGFFVGAGALFVLNHSTNGKFELQPMLGFKYTSTTQSSETITFTRVPLELLAFYRWNAGFRFGAGLKKDFGPRVKADGILVISEYNPFSKIGFVVQGDYWFTSHLSLGARATLAKFEDASGVTRSGDAFGLLLSYAF